MFLELILSLVVGFVVWTYLANRKPPKYPKGPISWPVLGHFPQIAIYSKGVFWQKLFAEYAKIYGDIFSVQLGPFPAVIITDVKLTKEAFNNPAIQGRPSNESTAERTGGVRRGILFNDGDEWHEQRRFALRHLRDFGFGKTSMEHMILDEAMELIEGLKRDSGKPVVTQNRFNIAVLNALWTIISGERLRHDDPELQEIIATITRNVGQNLTGVLVSFFPILSKICPNLIGWEAFKEDMASTYNYLKKFTEVQLRKYDGSSHDNFSYVYINEIKKTTDPKSSFFEKRGELTMTAVMQDLFLAGAETTSTTLTWACLYLSLYPEKQEKLRQEIDQVLGGKLPSLDDRPRLPYTESVIMETMRFSSLVPMVAHTATENTTLAGHYIPKDTGVFSNLYAIHHSADIWGDPENFRPERFLEKDGSCSGKHECLIPFAVGKRVCLGESLARNELFLFLTSVFQNFEVTWDQSGPKPGLEGVDGAVVGPKPHKLVFSYRK